MAREVDGKWLFCNYCGEGLPFGSGAYDHVVRQHGPEVHVGPGDFDPRRKNRALTVQVLGLILTVIVHAIILLAFGDELDSTTGPLYLASFVSSAIGLFMFGELYSRKGEKPSKEIVMDLHVFCDVCGQELAYRDLFPHMETQHPEEYAVEREVYDPWGILVVSLICLGFVGMLAAQFLGESGTISDVQTILLFVASSVAVVAGFLLTYLFNRFYHYPRIEEVAKEWSERHHHSKKE